MAVEVEACAAVVAADRLLTAGVAPTARGTLESDEGSDESLTVSVRSKTVPEDDVCDASPSVSVLSGQSWERFCLIYSVDTAIGVTVLT